MIEIIQTDITTLIVDAIVNAANNSLLGGGGVDGAIHQAAGPELLQACKKLDGCATGQAKLTPGYNLPARYVIHTVGPIWSGGEQQEPEFLKSCYQVCMQLAQQHHLSSIAFPAISCGVYGYPVAQAAKIAISTISEHLLSNQHLQSLYLVCFGGAVLSAYNKQFEIFRHSHDQQNRIQ